MTNEVYIHGDVHDHVDSVDRWLNRTKPSRVVWLGDWFDSFGDNAEVTEKTAKYLAGLIEARPDDIFILGNHCLPYRFPKIDGFKKWGWTAAKNYSASKWMTEDHWLKFKIAHYEEFGDSSLAKVPTIFSHAGFHREFLLSKVNAESIDKINRFALETCKRGSENKYVSDPLGPLWTRSEPVVTGTIQIFGHTPQSYPRVIQGFNCASVNFDTAHAFAGLIDGYGVLQHSKLDGSKKRLVDFVDFTPAIS